MVDESKFFLLCAFLHFLVISSYVSSEIILQSDHCGSQSSPLEVRMTKRDEVIVLSHANNKYYESNRDCIVAIIGKPYYQFEIEIKMLDIDSRRYTSDDCNGLCCRDYLKIFNGYRVDNARIFPSIGFWGLCGSVVPEKKIYMTSHNFVTIQFRTDEIHDNMAGFQLKIKQSKRRNYGNIIPEGGYIGGWNDGTFFEMQLDWSEQKQIPSDLKPDGSIYDYGQEVDGITCYECVGCRIKYFNPSSTVDQATQRAGCHVCSKEYEDGISRANRRCYNRLEYNLFLQTLSHHSSGDFEPWRHGCKKFLNIRGVLMNYCFCDYGDLCNTALSVKLCPVILFPVIMYIGFSKHILQ